MLKLSFLSSVIILISVNCSSCKERLVELQRQAADSMNIVQVLIDSKMAERASKTKDSLVKIHPEWINDSLIYKAVLYDTLVYYGSEEIQYLAKQYLSLKSKNDSIGKLLK
jgi:hypothetical protein